MNIEQFPKPKKPGIIEDQIIRFSNNNESRATEDYEHSLLEQEVLFENADILKYIKSLENPSKDLGTPVVNIINEKKDAYLKFLRNERRIEAEYRKKKEDFYKENFKDKVLKIKEELKIKEPEEIEGYITPGSMGLVFQIEKNNSKYVVKFYDKKENKKEVGDAEITAMLRTENMDSVSHLYGYSHEDNVYVMNYIEGKTLMDMTIEEKPTLTHSELKKIIETTIKLYRRGVSIDTHTRNFILNKKSKVSIIDYYIDQGKLRNGMNDVRDLALNLCDRKKISTSEFVASMPVPTYKQIVALEKRMIKIIETDFPDFARVFKDDLIKWKNNV